MVRALLALMMRGRIQAMTASAIFATLSLLVPPLGYVSGGVIGLATLKQGPREAGLVIAGSVLLSGVLATLMTGTPAVALVFLGMSWLPAWLLAMVLVSTRSQGMTLVSATVLGLLAVIVVHLAIGTPAQWWREVLESFFASALEAQGGEDVARVKTQLVPVLDEWAPRMTRFFGAATVVGLVLPLLLARWGHAVLDNPGGFGREFRELRVGRPALGVALAIGVVAMFVGGGAGQFAADLMGPVTAMLLFAGLAVAHGVVHERGMSTGWLVAMYLLLVVPPNLFLPLLMALGLLDGWFDFRARARGKS